jgi:hypothetical protein
MLYVCRVTQILSLIAFGRFIGKYLVEHQSSCFVGIVFERERVLMVLFSVLCQIRYLMP